LERAYIFLSDGALEDGRQALLMAVGGLAPATATEVIQLASLLQRLSPRGAALLARAGVAAHRGWGRAAADTVVNGLASLPEEERATLLAEAARMAHRADAVEAAADLRRLLLDAFPEAPEAAEATLGLARYAAAHDAPGHAVRLLEELIAQRPTAAVVPDARRELERLRAGGSG
jgi:hypothetical protein